MCKGIGECRAITLTAGADSLSPTSAVAASKTTDGDDLFRAVNAGDLATVDFIDGGAGNDTLNVTALAANIKPILKNIENINVTFTGAGANDLDLGDSSGYTTVVSSASVTGASFSNVALGTVVGVSDNAAPGIAATTINFAKATGGADAATINLKDAQSGITVANIENLTLKSDAGTLAAVTTNTITLTAAAAETVTVSGAQALSLTTVAATEANLKSVDASALTKSLTFVTSGGALKANFEIKGGADADTLTFVGAQKAYSITGGAGADSFNIGTGGAGGQLTNLAAGDIANDTALKAAAVKITDFAAGDVLTVGNGALAGVKEVLTGTEASDVAAQTTLLAALNQAAGTYGAATAGQTYNFVYGDSTYIFVDVDGDQAVSAADGLVQLVGYTTALTGTNFVLA